MLTNGGPIVGVIRRILGDILHSLCVHYEIPISCPQSISKPVSHTFFPRSPD